MKFLGIIPARYGSTRLEGKPLIDIKGKPMIQWVYEKTKLAMKHVVVATDDERILSAVQAFGGEAVMTSSEHNTGTNRCLEALHKSNKYHNTKFDVVINIQGDEPMLHPDHIASLVECFEDPTAEFATLAVPVTEAKDLAHSGKTFVTFDLNMNAMYFSRSVIPEVRGIEKKDWLEHANIYKHLGLYGYKAEALEKFSNLPQTNLEKAEKLEQNRWIEHGGKIKVGITKYYSLSVDTQEDLHKVRKII